MLNVNFDAEKNKAEKVIIKGDAETVAAEIMALIQTAYEQFEEREGDKEAEYFRSCFFKVIDEGIFCVGKKNLAS